MRWWSREASRQLLPLAAIPLMLLVPGGPMLKMLAAWDAYSVVYLLLTWLAFRRLQPSQLRTMALAARSRSLTDRLLVTTPEQISQGAAMIALVATVGAMPQAERLGAPAGVAFGVCGLAVVTAWSTQQTGFALIYLGKYFEAGGLSFPGDEEPQMIDFVYFSVSVGTTFGPTDVVVTQRRIRRHVLTHGVLAFLFNTLILAVAVAIVTTYLARA